MLFKYLHDHSLIFHYGKNEQFHGYCRHGNGYYNLACSHYHATLKHLFHELLITSREFPYTFN